MIPPNTATSAEGNAQGDGGGVKAHLRSSVGRKIRQLRLERERTQRQLCGDTGLAISYLSRLENGRISPSVRTLKKLSLALGVPLASFFEAEALLDPTDRCPVSLSGTCILEHPFVGRGRTPRALEGYSSDQLKILRQCNYILHHGTKEVISSLSTVIESLLQYPGARSSRRQRAAATPDS